MSYQKACDDIQSAWDEVTTKWSAEAKSKYFNQIHLPLLSEAKNIYRRNEDLEDYADKCVISLHI